MKVFCVIGTRPEAIKLAPLVIEFKKKGIKCIVSLTGQHGREAERALSAYGVRAHYDLGPGGAVGTGGLIAGILARLTPIIGNEEPEAVIVQGDTSSALAGAMAAFLLKIPVAHVEAGLRTGDIYSPYPEEANRAMIARIAKWNFAPDAIAAGNLKREDVPGGIYVTGNTVADALAISTGADRASGIPELREGAPAGRRVIVTSHRRENLGEPLIRICRAVAELARAHPDMEFIFPVHPNPKAAETVGSELGKVPGVRVVRPLGVRDMHRLIGGAYLVMTDSGGLCEESAICRVPVIVLRSVTERESLLRNGKLMLAGTETGGIVACFERLISDAGLYMKMKYAFDPICERGASLKICNLIVSNLL